MDPGPVTLGEVLAFVRDSAPGNGECEVRSIKPYIDALTIGSDGCERMEFLGDAILAVVVTQYLYERFPNEREGFLTKMRSKIVSSRMLCLLAAQLGLEPHVRQRKSMSTRTGPHATTNHLALRRELAVDDVLEAMIAAISIDMGMDAATRWFLNVLEHHVDVSALVSWHDTNKQRLVQLSGALTFTERSSSRGMVSVCVRDAGGKVLGTASAATKKLAEEDAARKALAALHGCGGPTTLPRDAMAIRPVTRSCVR